MAELDGPKLDGPKLDGPRIEPRSGTAKQLVVFLHGYGADGNDLIEIGRAWQSLLPDAAFVSPHAPRPVRPGAERARMVSADVARSGRALDRRQRGGARARMPFSTPNCSAAICRRRRWRWSAFRQGTMMALHVGLRRAVAPAAIVGYSGMLVVPEDVDPDKFAAEIRSKPPVLLVHGDEDQLIPVQALMHAAQGLAALEVPDRMAYFARRRPRHRPGRPAPRRRVSGQAVCRPPVSRAAGNPRRYFTIPSRCPITRRFAAWRQP